MAEAYKAGDLEQAAKLAEVILEQDTSHHDALRCLVRFHSNQKNVEEAFDLWARLTKLTPDSPEPYLQLARIERKKHNWRSALMHIDNFLRLQPAHEEALSIQVQCHLELSAVDKIGASFAKLCAAQPQGIVAVARQAANLGLVSEISESLRKMADAGDEDAIALCATLSRSERNAAIGYEIQRNAFAAAQNYHNMRILDSGSSYASTSLARLRKPFLERARQAYKNDNDTKAIEHATDCIKIEPTETEPYLIAGRAASRLGDEATAFKYFQRGIVNCDFDVWLKVNYARSAERLGKARLAYDAFQAVAATEGAKAKKYHPEAERSLARLPQRLVREAQDAAAAGDFDQAIDMASRLEADGMLTSDKMETLRQRIASLAQRELRKAYDSNDMSVLPMAKALTVFAPDNTYAFRVSGRLLMRARNYKDAIGFWRALVAKDPSSIEFQLNVTRCFHRLHDKGNAVTEARALLELDPEHAEGNQILMALEQA
ncbi:tetratricopeptide repeat protein [Yoonia sp. R2-816]|uniref:tetratricopeptide repeat protein n=1 Tax=Yoonia sp. R2-816 TaxID=3342638 RepID=UPI00372839A7